jgi:hypothetical protein
MCQVLSVVPPAANIDFTSSITFATKAKVDSRHALMALSL